MKKLASIIVLLISLSLVAAVPTQAQWPGFGGYGPAYPYRYPYPYYGRPYPYYYPYGGYPYGWRWGGPGYGRGWGYPGGLGWGYFGLSVFKVKPLTLVFYI